MNARKQWMIRLVLSLVFGIVVAAVPLYLLVGGDPESSIVGFRSQQTRRQLKKCELALNAYRSAFGVYPNKLSELDTVWRDSWRRPLLYSLPDGKPLIESLGRDGKRGGVGSNADLSNRVPVPAEARVPFWALPFDPEATKANAIVMICGGIAALLVFAGLRRQTFEPRARPALGIALLLALAIAIFGAVIIATVHVFPSH